jgi:hypothetical protein
LLYIPYGQLFAHLEGAMKMNYTNTHLTVNPDNSSVEPRPSMELSNKIYGSQYESWIGARVKSFKIRREFIRCLMIKLKLIS